MVSRMERRTKTGNKMGIMGLSDPTGHFEAVLFSEGLAQYRDVLEPGAAVLLQLGAELQGEDVRARVLHAEAAGCSRRQNPEGSSHLRARHQAARIHRQAAADAGSRRAGRPGPRPAAKTGAHAGGRRATATSRW